MLNLVGNYYVIRTSFRKKYFIMHALNQIVFSSCFGPLTIRIVQYLYMLFFVLYNWLNVNSFLMIFYNRIQLLGAACYWHTQLAMLLPCFLLLLLLEHCRYFICSKWFLLWSRWSMTSCCSTNLWSFTFYMERHYFKSSFSSCFLVFCYVPYSGHSACIQEKRNMFW